MEKLKQIIIKLNKKCLLIKHILLAKIYKNLLIKGKIKFILLIKIKNI